MKINELLSKADSEQVAVALAGDSLNSAQGGISKPAT